MSLWRPDNAKAAVADGGGDEDNERRLVEVVPAIEAEASAF